MEGLVTEALAGGSGAIVGLVLGLVGGGGSILAVPLLVYLVGVASPHVAIGTGAVAVAASALGNLFAHWRAGTVKWPCAAVFAGFGVLGALAGSSIAKSVDGEALLSLFGLLMIGVAVFMLLRKSDGGDPTVRLSAATAPRLGPPLVGTGLGVGTLSGFFGIGGGFLIVPGLVISTGMPLRNAIGTSLVAVTAFGTATAANYALSGLVDWPVAAAFVAGGLVGGVAGIGIGRRLAERRKALAVVFATIVMATGIYVVARGL